MHCFLGVTHHSTGLTHTKVLLATETERKMENINDISFRSGVYSSTDDVTIVFYRRHIYIAIFIDNSICQLPGFGPLISKMLCQGIVGLNFATTIKFTGKGYLKTTWVFYS